MTLPTLIFDEVDAGVSGEVARKMGTILHALSGRHQVICITHSPQVAARAEKHFWVYKEDTPTRTLTALRELSQEERTIEIAKMLSGNPPSDAALANARELMAK
jgi:DNA repair protein RecN (Recombination protein N)